MKTTLKRRLLMGFLGTTMLVGGVIGSAPANATCNGCTANWGLFPRGSDWSGIRHNTSDEAIVQQDFHGSLIQGCAYDGTQLFNMNHSYDGISNTPVWGTPEYPAPLLWAGGHHWFNDGVNYYVWVADTSTGC